MKYIIEITVQAVLLIDKNAESIFNIALMLGNIPHVYTKEGLTLPGDKNAVSLVEYGNYLIKEDHGFGSMTKELFEKIAVPLVEIEGTET